MCLGKAWFVLSEFVVLNHLIMKGRVNGVKGAYNACILEKIKSFEHRHYGGIKYVLDL
jgi:hypothetical protein